MTKAQLHAQVDAEYKAFLDAIPDSMGLHCGDIYRMWAREKETISVTGQRICMLMNLREPN